MYRRFQNRRTVRAEFAKKKGKDDESILENEIFHIMEVSLKEALDMALDDILKEWK